MSGRSSGGSSSQYSTPSCQPQRRIIGSPTENKWFRGKFMPIHGKSRWTLPTKKSIKPAWMLIQKLLPWVSKTVIIMKTRLACRVWSPSRAIKVRYKLIPTLRSFVRKFQVIFHKQVPFLVGFADFFPGLATLCSLLWVSQSAHETTKGKNTRNFGFFRHSRIPDVKIFERIPVIWWDANDIRMSQAIAWHSTILIYVYFLL